MSKAECFDLFRQIRVVAGRLSRERDADLKLFGLTSNQANALLYLESNEGCQITDLRDHLEISHQAASMLVGRLRDKGLLEVDLSDSDGRARCLSLSGSGIEKCAEIRRVGGDTASHALSNLTPEERAELRRILGKISENIGGDADRP